MVTLHRSVDIEAPLERVFAYMTDPDRLPEIWPSMVEVSHVNDRGTGRNSFDMVYKMAGIKLKGHASNVEIEPGRCVDTTVEGALSARLRWTFDGDDRHTGVTVDIDYAVPLPVLGRLAEPLLARLNEREIASLLSNLKMRMEDASEAADYTA